MCHNRTAAKSSNGQTIGMSFLNIGWLRGRNSSCGRPHFQQYLYLLNLSIFLKGNQSVPYLIHPSSASLQVTKKLCPEVRSFKRSFQAQQITHFPYKNEVMAEITVAFCCF